jgi:hypothetical protein
MLMRFEQPPSTCLLHLRKSRHVTVYASTLAVWCCGNRTRTKYEQVQRQYVHKYGHKLHNWTVVSALDLSAPAHRHCNQLCYLHNPVSIYSTRGL